MLKIEDSRMTDGKKTTRLRREDDPSGKGKASAAKYFLLMIPAVLVVLLLEFIQLILGDFKTEKFAPRFNKRLRGSFEGLHERQRHEHKRED